MTTLTWRDGITVPSLICKETNDVMWFWRDQITSNGGKTTEYGRRVKISVMFQSRYGRDHWRALIEFPFATFEGKHEFDPQVALNRADDAMAAWAYHQSWVLKNLLDWAPSGKAQADREDAEEKERQDREREKFARFYEYNNR